MVAESACASAAVAAHKQPNAPLSLPSCVPELLHAALGALSFEERALAVAFFSQDVGGRKGTHEIVLSTETKRDGATGKEEPTSHVILRLDFDGGSWKRVRRKVSMPSA